MIFGVSLLGQQRLRDIRGRTSVPRVVPFGPAAPSRCSRQDFGPSSCLFRASSAFETFEAGLRSLELSLSGQQRLRDVRGGTLVPRVVSFGPAALSRHSRQDFGPSSCLFRASSAFETFGAGLQSLELSLSRQQRLRDIRGRASICRVVSFDPIIPSENSGSSFGPLNHLLRTCLPSYQCSSINMPEYWLQYTSSDAVCQIQR
jgi:hypothetical protein